MKYIGVPTCPYCRKRVNLVRTWSLKKQGEYQCPRCGGFSNIYLSPLVYVMAFLALAAGGVVYFFHRFVLEDINPNTVVEVIVPFAAFFLLSLFMVYLEKPVIKKVSRKKGAQWSETRSRRGRREEAEAEETRRLFYEAADDYLPRQEYQTGVFALAGETIGDMDRTSVVRVASPVTSRRSARPELTPEERSAPTKIAGDRPAAEARRRAAERAPDSVGEAPPVRTASEEKKAEPVIVPAIAKPVEKNADERKAAPKSAESSQRVEARQAVPAARRPVEKKAEEKKVESAERPEGVEAKKQATPAPAVARPMEKKVEPAVAKPVKKKAESAAVEKKAGERKVAPKSAERPEGVEAKKQAAPAAGKFVVTIDESQLAPATEEERRAARERKTRAGAAEKKAPVATAEGTKQVEKKVEPAVAKPAEKKAESAAVERKADERKAAPKSAERPERVEAKQAAPAPVVAKPVEKKAEPVVTRPVEKKAESVASEKKADERKAAPKSAERPERVEAKQATPAETAVEEKKAGERKAAPKSAERPEGVEAKQATPAPGKGRLSSRLLRGRGREKEAPAPTAVGGWDVVRPRAKTQPEPLPEAQPAAAPVAHESEPVSPAAAVPVPAPAAPERQKTPQELAAEASRAAFAKYDDPDYVEQRLRQLGDRHR